MALVRIDRPQPHTAVVTLDRPERLNAMSIELVIELDERLEEIAADNDTWVVVLTGAGRAFCSGLDLKDYGIIPNIDGLTVGRIAQRSMRYYSRLILTLRRMPQPVIAAVNGPAYGGGMCLTLGAEMRLAAESATFNATGIVNGLTSTELAASWLLPRLVGAAALERHAPHRPADRRRRGVPHGPGVARDPGRGAARSERWRSRRACASSAPTGSR